ncbi:MAG TPA: nitroreductase, partial [Chloroflexota bacterium]|nr:nitroreductase [Chloroflexota bacterium]
AETAAPWQALRGVVRERRSNLRIDPQREVPPELVQQLLELACWAPNHKHTHPWRFAVVTGPGRARLGETAAAGLPALGITDPGALAKMRTKYLRAPVVLVVGSAAHPQPHLHRENGYAVAAGVQNLLLGATALGLASFWGTGAATDVPGVKELVGLRPEDEIVALIYLGWPVEAAPDGFRAPPVVTHLDS